MQGCFIQPKEFRNNQSSFKGITKILIVSTEPSTQSLEGCPKTRNAGNPETWNSGMTETRKTSPGILKPGITFLGRQKLEQF